MAAVEIIASLAAVASLVSGATGVRLRALRRQKEWELRAKLEADLEASFKNLHEQMARAKETYAQAQSKFPEKIERYWENRNWEATSASLNLLASFTQLMTLSKIARTDEGELWTGLSILLRFQQIVKEIETPSRR
jgi:hypothetical protein